MMTITRELRVCECCTLMLANDDESGCRDYWGHTHAALNVPAHAVLGDEIGEVWSHWTCDGCGSDMLPGATAHTAVVLGRA